MLKRIEEKVDKMEEQMSEVENINENVEEIKDKLAENLGVLPVYREIIASNRRTQNISIITIIFLSILLIINIAVTIHNETEFRKYRENSISKEELITILDTFTQDE